MQGARLSRLLGLLGGLPPSQRNPDLHGFLIGHGRSRRLLRKGLLPSLGHFLPLLTVFLCATFSFMACPYGSRLEPAGLGSGGGTLFGSFDGFMRTLLTSRGP